MLNQIAEYLNTIEETASEMNYKELIETPIWSEDVRTAPVANIKKALCVVIQNVSVCTGNTSACSNTCGRVAGTHGDVLNRHTEVLSIGPRRFFSVPHHTQQNNTPERRGEREDDREKMKRDRDEKRDER